MSDSVPEEDAAVATRQRPDPDRFIRRAKDAVCRNYNEHRDPTREALAMRDFYVTLFTMSTPGWTAIVQSSVIRSMMWLVHFDRTEATTTITVYKKLETKKAKRSPQTS